MSDFFQDFIQLNSKDKLSIYALLIAKLSFYPARTYQERSFVKSLLNEIKALFHNHEQDLSIIVAILNKHQIDYNHLSNDMTLFINDVLECLQGKELKEYLDKKTIDKTGLKCRFARLFEFAVATAFFRIMLMQWSTFCHSYFLQSVNIGM